MAESLPSITTKPIVFDVSPTKKTKEKTTDVYYAPLKDNGVDFSKTTKGTQTGKPGVIERTETDVRPTEQQQKDISTGRSTSRSRSRSRTTTTKVEEPTYDTEPKEQRIKGELTSVTVEDPTTMQTRDIYRPGQVASAERVATDSGFNVTADYTGEFYQAPGESKAEFERRQRERVRSVAKREAERLAKEEPGKEFNVSLRYTSKFIEDVKQKEQDKIDLGTYSSPAEDPNEKFFGDRPPGRETISTTPTYKEYKPKESIAETVTQKAVLFTDRLLPGSVTTDMTKEEFQSRFKTTPLGKLETTGKQVSTFFKSLPGKFDEAIEGKERFGAQQLKSTLSVTPFIGATIKDEEVTPGQIQLYSDVGRVGVKSVSVAGDVFIGQTLQDPVRDLILLGGGATVGKTVQTFKGVSFRAGKLIESQPVVTRSLLIGTGKGVKASTGIVLGGLAVADVASSSDPATRAGELVKEAGLISAGFSAGRRTSFDLFDRKVGTGAAWKPQEEFIALSPAEAAVQKPGVQRTISGGLVSDRKVYSSFVDEGLLPPKKSPLGIDDFYARSLTPKKGGSQVRLDESYGFPRFSLTESGRPVLTGTSAVGPRTRGFTSSSVRTVDIKTGKEYDIPSQFLDRRLSEQPSLRVIDTSPKVFAASDPLSAAVLQFSRPTGVSVKPRLSSPTSVGYGSETVLRTSSPSVASRPTFSFAPSLFKPRDEKGLTSDVFDSRVASRSRSVSDITGRVSAVGLLSSLQEDEVSLVETSPLTKGRSRSKSRSDVINDTVSDVDLFKPMITKPVFRTEPVVTKPVFTGSDFVGRDRGFRRGLGASLFPRVERRGLVSSFNVTRRGSLPGVRTASPGRAFLTEAPRFLRPGRSLKPKVEKRKKELFASNFSFFGGNL